MALLKWLSGQVNEPHNLTIIDLNKLHMIQFFPNFVITQFFVQDVEKKFGSTRL